MSYIKRKGYLIDRRLVWPTDRKFQIPVYVNKAQVDNQEDYNIVKKKYLKMKKTLIKRLFSCKRQPRLGGVAVRGARPA